MPAVRRFKSAEDVRKALAAYMRCIEAGTMDPNVGRCLIYGCATLTNIIREGELEKRIEALELQQRGEQ